MNYRLWIRTTIWKHYSLQKSKLLIRIILNSQLLVKSNYSSKWWKSFWKNRFRTILDRNCYLLRILLGGQQLMLRQIDNQESSCKKKSASTPASKSWHIWIQPDFLLTLLALGNQFKSRSKSKDRSWKNKPRLTAPESHQLKRWSHFKEKELLP